MAAPSNDNFANAIPFTTSVSGTSLDATLQSGESSRPLSVTGGQTFTTSYSFGSSVWYSYTAATTGFINFSVNRNYDAAIQIYGSGGLSTPITGNDDSSRGSDVSIAVTANVTYYIAVGGYSSGQGSFTLSATAIPSLFSINSALGAEGSVLEFVVTRSGDVSQASTVDYYTVDGSASSQSGDIEFARASIGSDVTQYDYQSISGTLTFEAGQRSQIVRVQTNVDQQAEGDEDFTLVLERSNNSPGYDVSSALFQGVGTIRGTLSATPTPTVGSNGTGSGGTYIPGAFYGTEGADTIIAQTASAILIGNGGNDTYLVNSSTDQVIEVAGGGSDIVYTTVSYNLGVNEVEALSTVQQTDTNAINLVGNFYSQIIVGNYGDNVLNGGSGGVDTLIGLFGNDTYAVGDARTVIVEQAGQGFDTLVTSVDYRLGAGVSVEVFAAQNAASTTGLRLGGNELAQTIAGTAGADTISGGGGRDVLLGGAGADTFVIGPVATGNVTVLADFVAGTDRIGLTSTAFNVGTSLDAAEFVAGTAATTADQRVIYDAGTGQLFYDADGNGAGAAVLFAQVVPGTAITAASFDVVVPTATTA